MVSNDCLPLHYSQRSWLWPEPQEGAEPRLTNMHLEGWTEHHCFAIFLFSQVPQSHFMSLHYDPCHRKTNRAMVLLEPGLKHLAQTQT